MRGLARFPMLARMNDSLSSLPTASARVYGTAIVLAPLLLLASSIAYITEGASINDGVLGGTIGVWSVFAFAIAFVGILRVLEPRAPRAAPLLTVLALTGFGAGVAFNVLAILTPVFGPEINTFIEDVDGSNAIAILAFLPWGWFAPLTFVLTGIMLWRTGTFARSVAGLLVVGGVLFIASRPEKIDALALIADTALIAALVPIGWALLTAGRPVGAAPAPGG